MTPLALSLSKQLLLPEARREVGGEKNILPLVLKGHCFEITAVKNLSDQLAKTITDEDRLQKRLAFLPAPVTILEYLDTYDADGSEISERRADMLVESDDGLFCQVYSLEDDFICHLGRLYLGEDAEVGGLPMGARVSDDYYSGDEALAFAHRKKGFYATLALINTPKIIGRRQHMPHAGFQRKLAHSRKMVGKFPLRAWTEIILEVSAPKWAGEQEHIAHLTGGKALHFCRQHLRFRLGRVELVSSHWRGDPSLGIKRSRYAVRA